MYDDLRSICSTRPSCHKWQMDFEVRRAKIDGYYDSILPLVRVLFT